VACAALEAQRPLPMRTSRRKTQSRSFLLVRFMFPALCRPSRHSSPYVLRARLAWHALAGLPPQERRTFQTRDADGDTRFAQRAALDSTNRSLQVHRTSPSRFAEPNAIGGNKRGHSVLTIARTSSATPTYKAADPKPLPRPAPTVNKGREKPSAAAQTHGAETINRELSRFYYMCAPATCNHTVCSH